MLERLRLYQNALLKNLKTKHTRYFYDELQSNEKLMAIIGTRGVGKTTALLQYLQVLKKPYNEKLYISADWIDGRHFLRLLKLSIRKMANCL